jgi:ADP-ribose pyrophosphatase
MIQEGFTLLRATGLTKVSDGGGTEHEDIVVHRVPLHRVAETIAEHRAQGHAIDVRLLMLLGSTLLEDAAQ